MRKSLAIDMLLNALEMDCSFDLKEFFFINLILFLETVSSFILSNSSL